MRLDRITCRNLRGVREADIDLRETPRAVVMGLNGAGKSTLFTGAPLFALFGHTNVEFAKLVTRGHDSCEASIVFTFPNVGALQGATYRVRRTYSIKSGSTLQLELVDPDTHELRQSVADGRIREVQAEINELLGFSAEALLCGPMMRQGDAARFTASTPAERLDYVAQILGAEHWRSAYTEARVRARDAESRLNFSRTKHEEQAEITAQIASLEAELRNHEALSIEPDEDPTELEAEAAAAKAAFDEAAHAAAELEPLREKLATARKTLAERVRARDTNADRLQFTRGQLAELDALPDVRELAEITEEGRATKAEIDKRRDMVKSHYALEARIATLEPQCKALALRPEECDMDHCGLIVSALNANTRIEEAVRQIEDMPSRPTSEDIDALEQKRSDLAAEYQAAKNVHDGRAARGDIEGRIAGFESEAAVLAPVVESLEAAVVELEAEVAAIDVDALTRTSRRLRTADHDLAALRERNTARANRRHSHEQKLQYLREQVAELTSRLQPVDLTDLERDLTIATKAVDFCKVAPQIVVEARVGTIEAVANDVLAEVYPGTRIRIEQTKHGVTSSRDELTVTVLVHGVEAPLATFSGGEEFRLNLALRLGLAAAAGADVATLVLDEGWGSQDPAAVSVLKEAMLGLADRFERIYIVTHREEVADLFGCTLMVETTPTGTTIERG